MTSSVDLCNRALSQIGTRSTIASLSEASAEAVNCSLWYDSQRKALMRAAPWGFNRRQIALSQVGDLYPDATSPYPWAYAYAYPADCLKARYVLAPPPSVSTAGTSTNVPQTGSVIYPTSYWSPNRNNRFVIHNAVDANGNSSKLVLSNVYEALLVYTGDEQNPEMFDDMFTQALVDVLSYRLVIPLTGNAGMRTEFKQAAMTSIMEARAADGNEGMPSADHTPDWIKTRGIDSPYGMNPLPWSQWGDWYSGYDNMAWGG